MYNTSVSSVNRAYIVIFTAILFTALPVKSQVYVGGELTADAIYSPLNNPYIVTQDLVVPPDVTLTLLPGVQLQFEIGTRLVIQGTLIAKGNADQKIFFQAKSQLPFPGQWYGILFNNSHSQLASDSTYFSGSVLSDAEISNASYSVTLDQNSSLLIENTLVRQCSFGTYIKASGYNIIRNCTIDGCDFGIFIANGFQNPENLIVGNSITNCADVGIFLNSNSLQSYNNSIVGNHINYCKIGMHIGNYSNNGPAENIIAWNHFTLNKDAIKLFQNSNTINNNFFVLNYRGITLWQSDYNTITQNFFSRNISIALTFTAGSSYNNITYNHINYNSGGVWIKPDSSRNSLLNSFLYNTVYGNSDFSFQLNNTPQGPIQFNNIGKNGDSQSFINISDSLVHAEYNFWATTSESAVDSILFDMYDDPLKGEIYYTPMLTGILSTAPVPPPDGVIRQRIGNKVLISWNKEEIPDLTGYRVHFGKNDGVVYENAINVGIDTVFSMGLFSLQDTIAVTGYDFLADGVNDQTEGYESDFAYAVNVPYAGPDSAVCIGSAYSISDATADDFINLAWTSSGDGVFDDEHILNPVYIPGEQDYANGLVSLYLYAESSKLRYPYIDEAIITFHAAPVVFAGNDTIITIDSSLRLVNVSATGYEHLKWTTAGDGFFDSDTLFNPLYTPGFADTEAGTVVLTVTVFSACGSATDQINVKIDPGYNITGRVHAGSVLARNSKLYIYQYRQEVFQPIRSAWLVPDGIFEMKSLLEGSYYLYAVPDKDADPGYLPTYFFNDIHWENAYKLELIDNTYDVDINLAVRNVEFPEGIGSINGFCSTVSGSSGVCSDVTVFVFDKRMKNVLDWNLVRNGNNFRFNNLPFGDYVLVGEKTGIPRFHSGIISITPSHPDLENVELVCAPAGYKFSIPERVNPSETGQPEVFPNPTTDILYVSGLTNNVNFEVHIINSLGQVVKINPERAGSDGISVSVRDIPAGVYIMEVYDEGMSVVRRKVIKK